MSKLFEAPFLNMGELLDIKNDIEKREGFVELEGCVESAKCHFIWGLSSNAGIFSESTKRHSNPIRIIITSDEARAKEIADDYAVFGEHPVYFPARDFIFYQADIRGNLLVRERMEAIKASLTGEEVTIVMTVAALLEHMAPPNDIKKNIVPVRCGDTFAVETLTKILVKTGYEKVSRVSNAGQFAVRGGIVDVWGLTEEVPFRIEYFGDEIDSIRRFDDQSQRSVEEVEQIELFPAAEMILNEGEKLAGLEKMQKDAVSLEKKFRDNMANAEAVSVSKLFNSVKEDVEAGIDSPLEAYVDYFYKESHGILELFDPERTFIFFDEPAITFEKAKAVYEEYTESMDNRLKMGLALKGQKKLMYSVSMLRKMLEPYRRIGFSSISQKTSGYSPYKTYNVQSRSVSSYNGSLELLIKDAKKYLKANYKMVLLSPSRSRAARLADELLDNGLNAFYTEDEERELSNGELAVTYGSISRGFEYPMRNFVVITESDIFGRKKRKKRRVKNYEGEKISSFSDLTIGDYVVHENHGIGVYRGIEHIKVEKVVKDYLKLEYGDGGIVYVLATDFGVVQKYASADSKVPKLNSLGGKDWGKSKAKVVKAVEAIAKDLVELYAKRQSESGYEFCPDTVWQREFEEMFPYEETADQLLAIEATKRDMESKKIMDRLICGDVGYGKTEIALRAAFKAVQDSKQVVMVAPTTILSQQHYNNFVQRLKDFPVRIDLLNRFKSKKEQTKTLNDLKKGLVDIVIGTHRLFSKDVEFKDLGLLVVDEEQRFGVKHKENLKKLRQNVDVLTLSATPIPRTLHMSLVGIRDMSVLEEPPQDRLPIQTFVLEYNMEIIREAVERELSRGGQVYYVYNRVETISDITDQLRAVIPDAAIEYAHGRMNEVQLENLMLDFVNGDIDVLVSTTIIETGLDIPNVNTIIIHDSDRFGLSQLYQLRGRVGRSNRTAYAFLMYKRDRLLKEEAQKRLAAIREFTDLGSGFKIAMRDLEIRGAGNILGNAQHGHMEAVGYDLYCKLLNAAVKKEKGIYSGPVFTTSVDADADAFIPAKYVASEMMRLDLYKRIASVETEEEASDILDELTDRFGKCPLSVSNLVKISFMRVLSHNIGIENVSAKHRSVVFKFIRNAGVNPVALVQIISEYEGRLSLKNGENPELIYIIPKGEEFSLLDEALALLKRMQELKLD